jgi:hypothetical protein
MWTQDTGFISGHSRRLFARAAVSLPEQSSRQWQMSVPKGCTVEAAAADLLDALERKLPMTDRDAGPAALARWIFEAGDSGTIADDTVVWLHGMLLSDHSLS